MRTVFVTVGTTSFDALIETMVSPATLEILSEKGYNKLVLQIGKGKMFAVSDYIYGLGIEQFRYKSNIQEDMHEADLVISHSGAGSILEALEAQKSLIVVVNEDLMGNHQLELAEQLNQEDYLSFCNCQNLSRMLQNQENLKFKQYIPGNSRKFVSFVNKLMRYKD